MHHYHDSERLIKGVCYHILYLVYLTYTNQDPPRSGFSQASQIGTTEFNSMSDRGTDEEKHEDAGFWMSNRQEIPMVDSGTSNLYEHYAYRDHQVSNHGSQEIISDDMFDGATHPSR